LKCSVLCLLAVRNFSNAVSCLNNISDAFNAWQSGLSAVYAAVPKKIVADASADSKIQKLQTCLMLYLKENNMEIPVKRN